MNIQISVPTDFEGSSFFKRNLGKDKRFKEFMCVLGLAREYLDVLRWNWSERFLKVQGFFYIGEGLEGGGIKVRVRMWRGRTEVGLEYGGGYRMEVEIREFTWAEEGFTAEEGVYPRGWISGWVDERSPFCFWGEDKRDKEWLSWFRKLENLERV